MKIAAKDLEKAIAGLNIVVAYHPDEVDFCKEEIQARCESYLIQLLGSVFGQGLGSGLGLDLGSGLGLDLGSGLELLRLQTMPGIKYLLILIVLQSLTGYFSFA